MDNNTKVTTTCTSSHGLARDDSISLNEEIYRVVDVASDTTLTVRGLRWYEKFAMYMGRIISDIIDAARIYFQP